MCWLWDNADRLSGVGAILAFIVAVFALWAQRKHNRLSVRPLAAVTCSDLEDRIIVTLVNNGTGPLVVEKLRIVRDREIMGDALYLELPDWMTFRWYVGNIDGRSIGVGKSIKLLVYDHPSDEFRAQVRRTLADLVVQVHYNDIYNNAQPVYERSLKWLADRRPKKG